jgi:hypothetical protein
MKKNGKGIEEEGPFFFYLSMDSITCPKCYRVFERRGFNAHSSQCQKRKRFVLSDSSARGVVTVTSSIPDGPAAATSSLLPAVSVSDVFATALPIRVESEHADDDDDFQSVVLQWDDDDDAVVEGHFEISGGEREEDIENEDEEGEDVEDAVAVGASASIFPSTPASAPLDSGMYAMAPRGRPDNHLVASWTALAFVIEHCVSGETAADAFVKLVKHPRFNQNDLVSGRESIRAGKKQMGKTHAPLEVMKPPLSLGAPSADGTPVAPPISAWKGQHVTHRSLVSVLGEAMCVSGSCLVEGQARAEIICVPY